MAALQDVPDLAEAKAWIEDPAHKCTDIRNITTVPGKGFRLDAVVAHEVAVVLAASFPDMEKSSDDLALIESSLGMYDLDTTDWLLCRADDGQLVGLAALIKFHNGVLNHNFCVLPSHRQQGLGLDLLEILCVYAVELGHDRVIGTTNTQSASPLPSPLLCIERRACTSTQQ